jgi:hypothetical protein
MNINDFSCNILKQKVQNILGQIGSLEIAVAHYLGVLNYLKKEFSSKSVEELLREEKYRKIFLGGLNEDLQPSPNSLSKFYSYLYCVEVDEDGLKEKLTSSSSTSSKPPLYAKVNPEKSFYHILENVSQIFQATQEVMKTAQIFLDPKYRIQVKDADRALEMSLGDLAKLEPGIYELKSAEDGVEIFENLLKVSFAVLPDYNEDIFMFISLATIPRFYAEKTHPYLKNKACETFLKAVMGWDKLYIPENSALGADKREKYSIWGYPPNTLGSQLVKVVNASWNFLDKSADVLRDFGLNFERPSLRYFTQAMEFVDKVMALESPVSPRNLRYLSRYYEYKGKFPYSNYYALQMRARPSSLEDQVPLYKTVFYNLVRDEIGNKLDEYIRLLEFTALQMYLGIASVEIKENGLVFIFNTTDTPYDEILEKLEREGAL